MPKKPQARLRLQLEPLCHYCGKGADTVDHIIPQSAGGPHSSWNLVSACRECNLAKGASWPMHDCERCKEAERLFILTPQERRDARSRDFKTYGSRTYWRSIARGYQPYTTP